MKLTDIPLDGLGRFNEAHGSFTVSRYHLEIPWDYQLYNGLANVRMRHDGGIYFQMAPPGGPIILNQEKLVQAPSMFVWIIPHPLNVAQPPSAVSSSAFTNYWMPISPTIRPGTEPKAYTCTFEPESVRYHLEHDDFIVDTEIFSPLGEVSAVMTFRIRNVGKAARRVTLMPVVRPYLASSSMKPWDLPEWYQTCAFTRLPNVDAFWLEMRDNNGNPKNRISAGIVTSLAPTSFETVEDRYIGKGTWDSPEALWQGTLAKRVADDIPAYGEVTAENAAVGQPPVAATARQIELAPGAAFEFTQVVGMLNRPTIGQLPPSSELVKLARYFDPAFRAAALAALKDRYDTLFSQRQLKTPDESLNRYINEHLALQLLQVQVRGRSSIRGVRDNAQDATAFVPIDPALPRKRIVELLDFQRSDGWFLRQYIATSKTAAHDARTYVDSGLWVFELLWEYLVYTRDFALLQERIAWLDKSSKDSVLDHVIRIFDYYLDPENIGEHGLCKIREGDWNDSVNAAGLEGRGETVMVTAHAVYCLTLTADLLRTLPTQDSGLSTKDSASHAARFEKAAASFQANLLKHALNSEGYFNGVFNDAGKWLFSPHDPDGRHRINSTPNTFAIIAGIVQGKDRDKLFDLLNTLKGPYGWRLFYPPVSGEPPIEKMGRIGQGDKASGLGENGCPYNHGSHGFLARAAWSAGKGDFFYDVTRHLLPYDQAAHPVATTKTSPFAIVNNYLEAIGLEGQGGKPYGTGSTPVAARNAFDGFLGFRPNLHYLVIDPVMPAAWETSGGHANLFGGRFNITIHNPRRVQAGVTQLLLDGKETGERYFDKFLGRDVIGIPIASLKSNENHDILVILG